MILMKRINGAWHRFATFSEDMVEQVQTLAKRLWEDDEWKIIKVVSRW
jgi:hypothetical protein